MREIKEGVLVYDEQSKRMDIRFDVEEYYGGLHCGEGIEIKVGNTWYFTGIEYDGDWYLSSPTLREAPFTKETFQGKAQLIGLPVRITR